MNYTYDDLLIKFGEEVDIYEHNLKENPIVRKKNGKGFYYRKGLGKGTIFIDKNLTQIEKKCTLAEEIGHDYTSCGNILNLKFPNNAKQERKAREWACTYLIDLNDFIKACNMYDNVYQIAKELEVTPEVVTEFMAYLNRNNTY